MNINVSKEINVDIRLVPKKVKGDKTNYCIYIAFSLYQKGLKQFEPSISTGIIVKVKDWSKNEVAGRDNRAKLINERLSDYLQTAKNLVIEMSLKHIQTCGELKKEVEVIRKKISQLSQE